MERLWMLATILGQGMQSGLAERGLTRSRAHVIWQLQRAGPSTQRSLSQALNVTPRNVTGLIDALEEDGLVTREAHPSDRRATLVTLTAKGSQAARAMWRDQDQFAKLLLGDIPAAELATFVDTLDRILRRINAVMPGLGRG